MSRLTSGGGGLPVGSVRFTACNWIGIVMISITSSTSITSISGVVLMSIMTSGSRPIPPGTPTFIDMSASSSGSRVARASAAAARRRLDDERDLRDPGALARVDHAPHALVVAARVAADLHFGLRRQHGDLLPPATRRCRGPSRGWVEDDRADGSRPEPDAAPAVQRLGRTRTVRHLFRIPSQKAA